MLDQQLKGLPCLEISLFPDPPSLVILEVPAQRLSLKERLIHGLPLKGTGQLPLLSERAAHHIVHHIVAVRVRVEEGRRSQSEQPHPHILPVIP